MPAPTYVAAAETAAWNSFVAQRSTGTLAAAVGDVILGFAANEGANGTNQITQTGSGVTLTLLQDHFASSECEVDGAAGVVAGAGSVSSSINNNIANRFGGVILQFTATDGVGASGEIASPAVATSHSFSVTTTQPNSAIGFLFADWNAVDPGSIAETISISGVGSATLVVPIYVASGYTVWYGYFADVGAAGTKTLQLTTGATNTYVTAAGIEVLGSAAAGGQAPRSMHQFRLRRAA